MTLLESSPGRPLRFGSRGSALALAQAHLAIERFHDAHPLRKAELIVVRTEGDADRTSPLTVIGGRGVFTNAIEARILDFTVDAAVHSAKDLPTTLHHAAPIVAMPDRDDPRDVLVSRHNTTLDALPANPVIGTSSRRREAQILRLRPDARVVNIRGNIDTRLRKSQSNEIDAIVIAAAGLSRLGWTDRISQHFPVNEVIPSPGQGAIAIQAMAGSEAAALVAAIDDCRVSSAVNIERAFLASIGAGCTLPVGAIAQERPGGFHFLAMLADPTGTSMAFADEQLTPGDEEHHAMAIARRMMATVGVGQSKSSWNGWSGYQGDLSGMRVAVTRPRRQAGQLMTVLASRGAEPISLPTIRVEHLSDTSVLDNVLKAAARGEYDWMAMTSSNAVDVVAKRLQELSVDVTQFASVRVAAIGPATALAATEAGLNVAFVSNSASSEAMATQLVAHIKNGASVLYPRSTIGRDELPERLREAGIDVDAIDAYQTLPESDIDPHVLDQIRQGQIDAITFTSPSSVHNLIALLGSETSAVSSIPAICAGMVTAKAAIDAGLTVTVVSADPGASAIADAMVAHWCRSKQSTDTFLDGQVMAMKQAAKGSVE